MAPMPETQALLPREHSRRASRSLSESDDVSTLGVKPYGPVVALAMALNYIIGTGCFGLPYAFMKAGVWLTTALLLVGAAGSVVTMNYTLESLARAEGVCAASHRGAPRHEMTFRKFEFATVGDMFAGRGGKLLVQLIMVLYCVGSLWSYASVFASSMSSLFFSYALGGACDVYGDDPSAGCLTGYYAFMGVFAAIVLSMVLMDLSDQATVQKFLSGYRIVAFLLMLVTMLVKLAVDGGDVVTARADTIGAANWSNFGKGFGPTLLALNCQYNMPDALQPLEPKRYVRTVAFAALAIAGVFYLLVGLLGALAFDQINPLATLMWSSYSGCGNGWADCGYWNPLGTVVQLVILLFPVINVVSAYPMVGVTVGDNMHMSFPREASARFGHEATRSMCRLAVAVPPILLAVVFKKLDFIFSVAGLFGFLLGLSIPCWFQVVGTRYCQRVWGFKGASVTPFTAPVISSVPFAGTFLVLTFGILAVAIATLNA